MAAKIKTTSGFDHLVEIFVPTICRCREPLPDARLTEVLDETKAKMSEWFGGGSVKVERIEGFWGGEDGTTVEEPVYLVFSNTNAAKLQDYREDVMAHTAGIANRLTQEATALRIDGKMYQFPSTGDPRPHRCGEGSATARTSEPRLADKNTRKRFLQAALQRVDSLTGVRDVFCNHLHYEFADDYLPTPNWPDGLKQFLAPGASPRLLAAQNGFRIIYLQLAKDDLRKGYERQLIERLIKDDPALRGLVVVSDVAQKQWNLVNVKFSRDGEAGKKIDRMLLRRMRVGPGQPVRTAVERLIEVDVEILGEDKDAAAIQDAHDKAFDVEAITRQFFTEIAGWYFWALPQVKFPNDTGEPDEKVRATSLIRMLTRLIFCWFLREKKLMPGNLFDQRELAKILKDLKPGSCSYYQGILQNLFFATLNQRMGKDKHGRSYRAFACDEGFEKNRSTYGVDTLYRYEEHFREPDNVLDLFADIPFLNGGLFECLDRTDEDSGAKLYIDGFSRNTRKRAKVPNDLFFAEERTVDLSEDFGDSRRRREKVRGLVRILHSYNFTIEENTPVDEEVALDPELLGKVFENLLASYNEETKTTARKQTGSFYTPRPIVDYMVDESLKTHLTRALVEKAGMKEAVAKTGLDQLFTYSAEPHQFSESGVATLITAIDEVKILDPACGSGAFPMGVLHKLVHILGKLDPDNERWKQTQLAKLDSAAMREVLEVSFADNNDDYGRKLYLIENCLYGVDIQPIAIQITKLRFFISLICDQKTNRSKKDNHGIRPLPNLETKFVAANTLIGLPKMDQMELVDPRVYKIEAEIETLYHNHFSIERRDQKLAVQCKVKALRKEMADLLAKSLMSRKKSEHIAEWDPFDPQSSADFFDPHWMYGKSLADGFDIVIGNPPYVRVQNLSHETIDIYKIRWETAWKRIDVSTLFMEFATKALRPGGVAAFISSNQFLVTEYGEKIREYFLTKAGFLRMVDFADLPIFDNTLTYVSVFVFGRRPTPDFEYAKGGSLPFEPSALSWQKIEAARLSGKTWVLGDNQEAALFDKLSNDSKPLGELATSWAGIITGLDEVLLFDVTDPRVRELEKDVLMPVLRAQGCQRYIDAVPTKLTIYPYKEVGGRTVLLSEDELKCKYPKAYTYLISHKTALSNRRDSRTTMAEKSAWYGLVRFGRKSVFEQTKIVSPGEVRGNKFSIDRSGAAFSCARVFAITETAGAVSLELLLGLLNSKLIEFYLHRRAPLKSGGYYSYSASVLSSVPVKTGHAAGSVERLVKQILKEKRTAPAANTSALEREIDQQVYALYGLTPEEIAIVESTAL